MNKVAWLIVCIVIATFGAFTSNIIMVDNPLPGFLLYGAALLLLVSKLSSRINERKHRKERERMLKEFLRERRKI